MEITINYSDEQFYSEELETLILRVLSKGAESVSYTHLRAHET